MESITSQTYPPGLYIVATPIGNLRDITLRALDFLKLADIILCEDTRTSARLLSHYAITAPTLSYHDHNGEFRRPQIMSMLEEGKRVALISDAGMPLISDPGYKLARDIALAGYHVSVLPGASSVLAALCISGLPTDAFYFAGFIPAKAQARVELFSSLAHLNATLIFFESAGRLLDSLKALAQMLGNRPVAVIREITKFYEEARRAPVSDLIAHYEVSGDPKGEIVLIVGAGEAEDMSEAHLTELLITLMQSHSLKEAASIASEQTGKSRKEIYAKALALKDTR